LRQFEDIARQLIDYAQTDFQHLERLINRNNQSMPAYWQSMDESADR